MVLDELPIFSLKNNFCCFLTKKHHLNLKLLWLKMKRFGVIDTPYLAHEKRQAFAYLFCPKSYHRPNLLTPYGKLKYNLSFHTKTVSINNFD